MPRLKAKRRGYLVQLDNGKWVYLTPAGNAHVLDSKQQKRLQRLLNRRQDAAKEINDLMNRLFPAMRGLGTLDTEIIDEIDN